MRVTEKIGSADTEVTGLFQATRIPVTLTVVYDCDAETVPETANAVIFDLLAAGYVIEINRPYGSPDQGSTITPITGYATSDDQTLVGFEVTAYSARRDTSAAGVFTIEITNELIEFQEYNHATARSTPTARAASVWRVNPNLPTLTSNTDPGVLVDDPLLAYDMDTSISGRAVDLNTQPITTPLNGTVWTFSCVLRRPYFASAGTTSLTTDDSFTYWARTADLLGGRLENAGTFFEGTVTGEGDYEPVIESLSFRDLTGTFIRMDLSIRVDEELNLSQVPLSYDGTIPDAVDNYGGPSLDFRITQAKSVGFMDTFPRVAHPTVAELPVNVLGIWQAYAGGSGTA